MSYQVIARKWRPQNFEEVTGQEHVTTPLRNAIRTSRVPHAILLAGPRGVGKTTLARIMARCLNCDSGPTESPCGECVECSEITAGVSTDVQEIDAASRTGVDDVRELNEAIRYAPSPGKHRIFVVDEVHMLTNQAFNALLKTLEEPPPNSLFIFATTNPEKIPFTVLSRCQRYDLRLFGTDAVAARLADICRAEGITISEMNLRILAREGRGSMRDSQTLLDQLISYGGTEVSDDTITTMLELVDRRLLLEILNACMDGDPAAALAGCQRALQSGAEAPRLADSLIQMLRDAVVMGLAPDLLEGGESEREEIRALAERGGTQKLRRMFKILVKEQEDLSWAPQPFAVLEMALVRLATLADGEDVAELVGRLKRLERQLAGGSGRGGASGNGEKRRDSAANRPDDAVPPQPTRGPAVEKTSGGQAPASEVNGAGPSPPPDEPEPLPGAPTNPPEPREVETAVQPAAPIPDDAPLEVVMDRLKALVQSKDRALFTSLESAKLMDRNSDSIRIAISNSFHRKRIQDRSQTLRSIAKEFFGRPFGVEILAGEEGRSEPQATALAEAKRERQRKQRNTALNHPAINVGLEELRGEIVEIRVLSSE